MAKYYSYPFVDDNEWHDFLSCFNDIKEIPVMDVTSSAVINGKFCKARVYYIQGVFSSKWRGVKPDGKLYTFQIGEHENIHGNFVNIDLTELLALNGLCPWNHSSYWACPSAVSSDRRKKVHLPSVTLDSDEDCWPTLWGMIKSLRMYDGKSLESMKLNEWWDVDNMWWLGPFSIGDLHGLNEFQTFHQSPFLDFIPDRDGSAGINKVIFSEKNKGALMGHPSMSCTHKGSYFGFKPEVPSKQPRLFVNDFWTCKDGRLVDNWCQIDMIDLFRSINSEYQKTIDEILLYNR